jgi:cobalt-precorrin-5B (C1)-methyltransferase
MDAIEHTPPDGKPLRRGWTTGACATAAAKSALAALLGGNFLDPVAILLPGGQTPVFALAHEARGQDWAEAGIIKDAGDDPDVTHGALVIARVEPGAAGAGTTFAAGRGVGVVTRPGLPIGVGEPAINPVPRRMMTAAVAELAGGRGVAPDFRITVAVRDGEKLAEKTWNPRLGIVGGLSILGTTGIVVPYSCAAWIHSIRSGIDVARALGLAHVVGSTGDVSERAAMARLGLPLEAFIDMGDFVGGMLKYLRDRPVPRVTIAGGFGKMSKLGQGALDLHSARADLDLHNLTEMLKELAPDAYDEERASRAASAAEVLGIAAETGVPLAGAVARRARDAAQSIIGKSGRVDVLIVDRKGVIVGESG